MQAMLHSIEAYIRKQASNRLKPEYYDVVDMTQGNINIIILNTS